MLSFFKQHKIKYRFPFLNGRIKKEEVIIQIKKDKDVSGPHKILPQLKKFFINNGEEIIDSLKEYNNKLNISHPFHVYLSYYGCDGYYYLPDIIVVNIYNNTIDYIIENILHEIVHLLIEKKYKNYSYQRKEKVVDQVILKSGLKKYLPNYRAQML